MPHAAQQPILVTRLTHLASAKLRRGRAQQAVVVQRLNDGDASVATGVVGGRRNQRKRVVEVRDIGRDLANRSTHGQGLAACPHRVRRQSHTADDAAESDAVVRSGVLDDFVAGRTEERRLGAEDLVLATSLLIVIVDAEDSHVYAACRTGSRQVGRRLAAC